MNCLQKNSRVFQNTFTFNRHILQTSPASTCHIFVYSLLGSTAGRAEKPPRRAAMPAVSLLTFDENNPKAIGPTGPQKNPMRSVNGWVLLGTS